MLVPLDWMEACFERVMEVMLRRAFRMPIQAEEIRVRLGDTIEAGKVTFPTGTIVVPNDYVITVHPTTLQQIANLVWDLTRDMEAWISQEQETQGYTVLGPIMVRFTATSAVHRNVIKVTGLIHEGIYTPEERDRQQHTDVMQAVTRIAALPPQILECRGHDVRPQRYIIHTRVTTIGRDVDNDLVLDYPSVSRHHARIEYRDGGFWIVDLYSHNGTWVNGRNVDDAPIGQFRGIQPLLNGDEISFGRDAVFQFLPYPGSMNTH